MAAGTDESVIDLLLHQHDEVKDLLDRLRNERGPKQEQFNELVRLLAVHESAEEQVVHPAARRTEAGDEIVEERLHEENEAKRVLTELSDLGVDHPEFNAKFDKFATAVLAHAAHEENEEFPALRNSTSQEQLRRMADAVRVAEAVAPTRPHPHAGESATANVVAGPPLSLFDRARDAVRNWAQAHRP
ncbi:hemerythrin domain-containing protein [Nocardia sp. NBC_00881]|uniref:hemerythrin domain-containing protein n=1 Tax=Nocardia sp. NBC_00881 TaxID=2975995 RepID=UPI003865DBD7|nr:hemerythrin domain-containing protein [Nocardia sp. NBC_00881]